MARYRYVTPALHGRWWSTRDEAVADALRAKQARLVPCEDFRVELLEYVRLQEDFGCERRGGIFPYADPSPKIR
jgi:hypothetical protein